MKKNDELVENIKKISTSIKNISRSKNDWTEDYDFFLSKFRSVTTPENVMSLVEERDRLIKLLKECIPLLLEYDATVIGEWNVGVPEAVSLSERIEEELEC